MQVHAPASPLRTEIHRLCHRQSARKAEHIEKGNAGEDVEAGTRGRGTEASRGTSVCRAVLTFGRPLRQHGLRSDFRVEIEKCVKALLELGLDLFARAFKHVHGDVCLVAVCQFEGGVVDLKDFAFGEEAHSVDKSQICHGEHLIQGDEGTSEHTGKKEI